ncbi:unnamed protein product, partial [Rotaria magnacalcarata]
RSVFERIFDSLIKGTHHTETSSNGSFINDEHDDETHRHDDPSTNPSSADISSSTSNNLAALTQ